MNFIGIFNTKLSDKVRRLGVASALFVGIASGAHAQGIPVYDNAAQLQWLADIVDRASSLANQARQIEYAISTLTSLTNIPGNLISRVQGLMQDGVRNPLGDINTNLNTLLNGSGYGTCGGAQTFLQMNQYANATGTDFMGRLLNGNANRMSGLLACTSTMMDSTQRRLDQLPGLLDQLQECTDVACTTAVSGRIQAAQADIAASQQQTMLMGQTAQLHRWTMEDQIAQKQRADNEAMVTYYQGLGGGGTASSPLIAANEPQPFSAQLFAGR